jgi:hypothetical protein
MVGAEVLAKRAGAEEHEARVEAHTADMADERGSGQDYEDTRVELREGIDASRRMHVRHNRPGDFGGQRVRRKAVGRHGTVQGVVVKSLDLIPP